MFNRLADYLMWANGKVLGVLDELPAIPMEVAGKFAHILAAEEIWLFRLTGRTPAVDVWPSEFSVGSFPAWIHRNVDGYRSYLEGLTPGPCASSIRYSNSKGETFESLVSDILIHVVAHGNYHRGQIAVAVKSLGVTPPITDYVFFARSAE